MSLDLIADAILNDRELPNDDNQPASPNGDTPENDAPAGDQGAPEPTPNNEPPAGDQPNNDQANTQTTDDQTGWIANVAKIAGKEFKTEDDLKNFFQKAKGNESLESELETIRQQLEEQKGAQPKFANERIQKLNDLYASGASSDQIKAFEQINAVGELKDLAPIDAVKIALQLRDGLTAEEADIKIKNTYKLDEQQYDADQIKTSNIDLKLDAKKDLEYLEQYKAKVEEIPANAAEQAQAQRQAELDQQVANYRKEVAPIAKLIQDDFTAIKGVNVNGKKGDEAVTIDLPVNEEHKAKISEWLTDYATINNIKLDDAGKEHLRDFAKRTLIYQNFDALAIHINNTAEERIRQQYHNPANIDRGNEPPATQNDEASKMKEFVLNM